jgi:hypothetical protein
MENVAFWDVMARGKLTPCRRFGSTLQSNKIKAEDRSEMSVIFLLGYTASHLRRRHSSAHVIYHRHHQSDALLQSVVSVKCTVLLIDDE